MSETSKLRPIKPLKITDLLPAPVGKKSDRPTFRWANPGDLFIEERYQRNISENSIKLIRKIYKDFEWARFKPPVCAEGEGGKIYIIDGQHTAIAAASHPDINEIPVMIVNAHTIRERAAAFMGHNRDRVAITASQLYYSAVAAGEEVALIVERALKETGATVVRYNPPVYVEGQTMAAGALLRIAEAKGYNGIKRILDIMMEARRAPIIALELGAVHDMLYGKDWQGKFTDFDLATTIRSKSATQWHAHAEATVRKGMPMQMKRALAIAWFKAVPKKKSDAEGKEIKK